MGQAHDFLLQHWFGALLLAVGLALGVFAFLRRRLAIALLAAAFGLIGLGGLAVPGDWALWLAVGSAGLLFAMFLVVVTTNHWWAPLGYLGGGLLFLGMGGLFADEVGTGLVEGVRVLGSLEPLQPWWLLLLFLVPVIIWLSFRSLAGLGPVRRWVAIALRCSLVVFLALALAEVHLVHRNEGVTVLFVVDRSLSIPEEMDADPAVPGKLIDRRWERIKQFLNEAVEHRGVGHERDQAGLIVFGRRPRLELPPASVPRFNFREESSPVDRNYTDVAAALKLALASFPEGAGKRIVLVSDGNENLGNAEDQARLAKLNGVQIDVVPLAVGHRNESEVLVQSVEAPANIEQGSQLPIRVLLRSYNSNPVLGTLTLKQITDGQGMVVAPTPVRVELQPGLNSFAFKQPLVNQQQSYTYEATFQPEAVRTAEGEWRRFQPGEDRVQNNRATTHVVARGQSRILFLESKPGEHQFLTDRLRGSGKFRLDHLLIDRLPLERAELGVFLSNYDSVILANVPASNIGEGEVADDRIRGALSDEQQEVIRSNVHDQGCGLVMIGGPDSFGAGGWQNTPVEKALPVDCDIKSLKVQGKGGLVLIMHASEISEGNRWQKIVAKLAIEKLSPVDMLGVTYYAWTGAGHTWHIPFQTVGENRNGLLRKVESMSPGDMPDVDPALNMAYSELTKPAYELATRHIIFISDGDHWQASQALLAKIKAAKITCTTVCITSHGATEEQKMSAVARATGGRFYNVKNPRALPAIYTKETRLVSQSFIHDKPFNPNLVFEGGPTAKLPRPLRPLYGYVRTTPKASPLVELPILTPPMGDQEFPVLAYWHYGLGKAVAFTSDARTQPGKQFWDREWAQSEMYGRFWEQVVEWSLRPVESRRLSMMTEYRDGKVRVVVDARDDKNRPVTDLKLRGGVTTPGGKAEDVQKLEVKFEQKNSGVYVAEFKADEAGSYFVNAQATRKVKVKNKDGKEVEVEEGVDSVRAGVTIPYSPEFSDLESNTALLERLREMTGGETYADDEAALTDAARSGTVFRAGPAASRSLQPVWYWLLVLTGVLLLFDVGVRRIAVDAAKVTAAAQEYWERLRGRATVREHVPEFLERLQSRKAAVSEELGKPKAARRFEGSEAAPAAPPGAGEGLAPTPPTLRPPPAPRVAPEPEGAAEDYASRLLKAKRRIQQERDKGKES